MPNPNCNNPEDAGRAKGFYGEEASGSTTRWRLGIESTMAEAISKSRPKLGPEECKVAYANVKPRVRMIMNYFAANLDGHIVLGTGDKKPNA